MVYYVTNQGDAWDLIAYKQLGSEIFTTDLISLNPTYKDIVLFPAGITLELPIVTDEDLNNAQADLSPWRRWEDD